MLKENALQCLKFISLFLLETFKHLEYSRKVILQCYSFGRNFQLTCNCCFIQGFLRYLVDSAGLQTSIVFRVPYIFLSLNPTLIVCSVSGLREWGRELLVEWQEGEMGQCGARALSPETQELRQ